MKHIFLLCPRFLICAGKIIDSHFVRTIPEHIYMYTVNISFKTHQTVKEHDTSLSSPSNITMRKNITDQNGAPGINVNALGYAINAKPGPAEQYQRKTIYVRLVTRKVTDDQQRPRSYCTSAKTGRRLHYSLP